jgi:Protein of unknown function (DUF1569)
MLKIKYFVWFFKKNGIFACQYYGAFYNMAKNSIFQPEQYAALRARLEALAPDATRQWGKMNAAQMLAHCNIPLESGLGKLQLPQEGNFITRPLLKWYVLSKDSFKPGLPTAKSFTIPLQDDKDFTREKARLLANLAEGYQRGQNGTPWAMHNMFGTLTPQQWAELTYMHLDHHLKQFGS